MKRREQIIQEIKESQALLNDKRLYGDKNKRILLGGYIKALEWVIYNK